MHNSQLLYNYKLLFSDYVMFDGAKRLKKSQLKCYTYFYMYLIKRIKKQNKQANKGNIHIPDIKS